MTTAELRTRLRVAAGHTSRGCVDTLAAAILLGVSRRTVQRWCAKTASEDAVLPPKRAAAVLEATRPTGSVLRQEEMDAHRARQDAAILGTRMDQSRQRRWASQGWEQPHLVHLVDHQLGPDLVHQVITTRLDSDQSLRVLRRGDHDAVRVPTRFHAVMVTHELLTQVDRWRCTARPHLVRGATQVWLHQGAPPVEAFRVYQQTLARLEG